MKTTILLFAILISTAAGAQTLPATPHEHKPGTAEALEKATSEQSGAIKKAKVFFVEPKNKATVSKTFTVKMGVEGMQVRPAGEAPDEVTSGHHHLVVDSGPVAAGQPVPTDDKHIHFGKGQTETTLTLPPGKHTLILQFADGAHRSFGPKLMQKIEITVK